MNEACQKMTNCDQCISSTDCADSLQLYACAGMRRCDQCVECAGLDNKSGWMRNRAPDDWEEGWEEIFEARIAECEALPPDQQ